MSHRKTSGNYWLMWFGGVSKTTLLKKINQNFCDGRHGFDVVIWVVVSKSLNLEKIQEDIGKRIGLSTESWKKKSHEDKALDISNILCRKKFVLLLDDMWEAIDLVGLGVPLQVTSKIVFTTRSLDVCGQMEADEKIEVKCLQDDEALELFGKKVGRNILESDTRILTLAKALVDECNGLPLALITIGRAMAYKKTIQAWEYAIENLRTSASKFTGMEEKVYSRLKFSYNNLSNDAIRSCFLYCSLFPEDYRISKRGLIDCWVGEGFLKRYDDGYAVIDDLCRQCLLEEDDEDNVKMHDVIRDMALWIACDIDREKENFLVQAGARLIAVPEFGNWKGIKRMSLMNNDITRLSTVVMCPDLLTLFLKNNDIEDINGHFFQSMSSLKVLDLSRNRNLCRLPSGISNLISLQHLDLSFTGISEFPKELSTLANLKCLKLGPVYSFSKVPRQLISGFKRLQVFRIHPSKVHWNIPEEDNVLYGGCELLVEELLGLKYLNALGITLRSIHALEALLSSHNLQSCTQTLYLQDVASLNVLFLREMKNLDTLYIWSCNLEELKIDCTHIFSIETHGFHSIHTVGISQCFKLRDLTWLILAPNLKKIVVSDCLFITEIISIKKWSEAQKMTRNINPFKKLQYLELKYLPDLKRIYPVALPFPHLKEISVEYCQHLKKLPLNSNSAEGRKIVIWGVKDWWEQLQWEDEATQNTFLPCFKSFCD